MSEIKLPVTIDACGRYTLFRDATGRVCTYTEIAAALNATAPGQAAEGQPGKIKIDTGDPRTAAVWEAAQQARAEVAGWPAWKSGRCPSINPDGVRCDHLAGHALPHWAKMPLNGNAYWSRSDKPDPEPAGEQRRCPACGSAKCEGTHMVRATPADAAPGGMTLDEIHAARETKYADPGDELRQSLSSLHSILERVAVDHTDLLTSDEHAQWMAAGALLNRLKSPAASTEK